MTDAFATVRLLKNEDKRIKAGHLWIYSNELDAKYSAVKSIEPGSLVQVQSADGKSLGIGYINPHSLISVRLLTRRNDETINQKWFERRLKQAWRLRDLYFDQPYYRLVYGDSDWLPGLVIDRFGDHFVVQVTTQGMQKLQTMMLDALIQVFKPASVLLKNDIQSRTTEDLPLEVVQAYGETPELVPLQENGVQFLAPVLQGQKTGWFYDHRVNRAEIARLAKGKRVLDVFSYVGAWGIQAAAAGASEVWCVDSSASALDLIHQNAALNNIEEERIVTVEGDAFAALNDLRKAQEKFDIVIVDPPAFIKRKKDVKAGIEGYRRINELALRLLNKEGLLVSASCSMHLQTDVLNDLVRGCARHLDRHLQLLSQGQQGPDHPVHPSIMETRYIKSMLYRSSLL